MIKTQIDELDRAVRAFERVIMKLEPDAFLKKLGGWTPRDIVAHLVGWNAYVVEGSRQLQRGELPFYDRDPGDNYEKVNAELIRKHGSTERDTLVLALESSANALAAFLRELEHDFGVQHRRKRHRERLIQAIIIAVYEKLDDGAWEHARLGAGRTDEFGVQHG